MFLDAWSKSGSSGVRASVGGALRLWYAARISRDFLRVSSILHAANSAAAAASVYEYVVDG